MTHRERKHACWEPSAASHSRDGPSQAGECYRPTRMLCWQPGCVGLQCAIPANPEVTNLCQAARPLSLTSWQDKERAWLCVSSMTIASLPPALMRPRGTALLTHCDMTPLKYSHLVPDSTRSHGNPAPPLNAPGTLKPVS